MSNLPTLQGLVTHIVHTTPGRLGITKLMKLIYLADVEHVARFGAPLTDLRWIRYEHGPMSQRVYSAVEELDSASVVHFYTKLEHRVVAPQLENYCAPPAGLSLEEMRFLDRALVRYKLMSLNRLKSIAYATMPMQHAQHGSVLDLSLVPEPSLAETDPDLKAFLNDTDDPDMDCWGDAGESAREDREIMREFSKLRSEANRLHDI